MTTDANAPGNGGTPAADQAAAATAAAAQAAAAAAAAAATAKPGDPNAPLTIGEEPAAKPNTPDPKDAAGESVTYEPTGDVGLDMALDFVGKLGLGPADPAMVAAIDGNFDLLKAKLGALGDKAKGWERFIALAEKSHKETSDKASAKVAKDKTSIHEAVGGEESWKQIAEWAGKNAEPDEKTQVNAALKQGGMVAVAMAQYLSGLYSKAGGTTVNPAEVTDPGASGKPASVGALTAKGYAQEVQALRAKLGYNFESSPAYVALQQRRIAGVQSNI